MSAERGRPDLDVVAKRFEDGGMSDEERSRRRSQDRRADAHRKGTLRRAGEKAIAGVGVGGALFAAGEVALHQTDGKPLGRTARAPEAKVRQATAEHRQDERARMVNDAIERAKERVAAGEPAPQSGVIEVSEAGTTGYVDLDSGNPEDTTTVTGTAGTGGLDAEQESDAGGIEADGSTS